MCILDEKNYKERQHLCTNLIHIKHEFSSNHENNGERGGEEKS